MNINKTKSDAGWGTSKIFYSKGGLLLCQVSLFKHLSIHLSILLSKSLSIYTNTSVCLSNRPSVCLSIHPCLFCPSVYLYPFIHVCLSIHSYMSVCLSIHPCLSVYLFVSLSVLMNLHCQTSLDLSVSVVTLNNVLKFAGEILPARTSSASGGLDPLPHVSPDPERHQERETALLLRHPCSPRSLLGQSIVFKTGFKILFFFLQNLDELIDFIN
jgi:hypothetical protein